MASNLLEKTPKKKVKNTNAIFQQPSEEPIDAVEIVEEKKVEIPVEKVQPEEKPVEQKEEKQEEQKPEEIPNNNEHDNKTESSPEQPQVLQVQQQEVTIITERPLSEIDNEYIEELNKIRYRIDNPEPMNRLNRRRSYTAERRRTVTIKIREDLSFLLDNLVDDSRNFKGLLLDEIIMLGMEKFIRKNGVK